MPKSRSPQWTYIILDHVFCLFVTSPMVPSFWRGCWFLYGHYVFPSNPAAHGWIMTAIGNLVAVPLYLMQNKLTRWLGNPHPITWLLGYHSFLLVFILTSVAQWKGIWQLFDHYTGLTVSSAMSSAAIAVVVLTMLNVVNQCPRHHRWRLSMTHHVIHFSLQPDLTDIRWVLVYKNRG